MYGNATYIKVNYLRYDSYSQKYQGTSGQVLIAFDGIFFLPEKLSLSPTCRLSLETHVQKANNQAFISVSECSRAWIA